MPRYIVLLRFIVVLSIELIPFYQKLLETTVRCYVQTPEPFQRPVLINSNETYETTR